MRIPRVFSAQPLTSGASIQLDEAGSHYLSKVLRMQAGRELVLFNGEGGEYAGEIAAISKKQVTVALGEFTPDNRESPLQLELAISVSRGERMDWVIQKATELGASRITPLLTERTEVKLGSERQEKKTGHWRQIVISACEQCQRNILPPLDSPVTLDEWLPQVTAEARFVLHHRDSQRLPTDSKPASVALLIGPEGGLSETEIEQARAAGFAPLTLGPRVLRTETAPVAAVSLVQYLWGDL
jgi:16S rRNA (uracil1498-N3)-methyltransferase